MSYLSMEVLEQSSPTEKPNFVQSTETSWVKVYPARSYDQLTLSMNLLTATQKNNTPKYISSFSSMKSQ